MQEADEFGVFPHPLAGTLVTGSEERVEHPIALKELTGMRILAYCIMPNHFHLALYPRTDDDLAEFMGWLTTTHVRQYRARTESIGNGHLYQDRFKSFPVETNEYAVTLVRYIEQNPLRAHLVEKAQEWRWSSLWRREEGSVKERALLDDLPFALSINYLQLVNHALSGEQLDALRYSVIKGKPYGADEWVDRIIDTYKMGHTLRGSGRPKGR